MGLASGKPKDSTLHIHPVLNTTSEFGVGDDQISHISSIARKKMFRHQDQADKRKYDSARWHSDIQFEPNPADFTSLRLTQLPETGGDTLFASGYEIYDRFSRPYQKFFGALTRSKPASWLLADLGVSARRGFDSNVHRLWLSQSRRGRPGKCEGLYAASREPKQRRRRTEDRASGSENESCDRVEKHLLHWAVPALHQ